MANVRNVSSRISLWWPVYHSLNLPIKNIIIFPDNFPKRSLSVVFSITKVIQIFKVGAGRIAHVRYIFSNDKQISLLGQS